MTKKIYEGKLIEKNDHNSDLYLSNYKKPLDMIIEEDSKKYGSYILVKYWISDRKLSESELDEKFMDTYYDTNNESDTLYFEISEYLWNYKGLGCKHDLIKELRTYINNYCKLDIDYSKKARFNDRTFISND